MRYALTSAIAAATPPSSSRVGRLPSARARALRGAARRRGVRRCRRCGLSALEQPLRGPGCVATSSSSLALEERAPLRRDGLRVLEVLLEQELGVARVQAVDVGHAHVLL